MILPAGPATGNRTCILEKKRQQGFSGETTLVVPRCLLSRVVAAFPLFAEKSAVEKALAGKKTQIDGHESLPRHVSLRTLNGVRSIFMRIL